MTLTSLVYVAALLVLLDIPVADAQTATTEVGIDRFGSDFKRLTFDRNSADHCRNACLADKACRAYTHVKPGIQEVRSVCYLKKSVPTATKNSCCISGVKKMPPIPRLVRSAPVFETPPFGIQSCKEQGFVCPHGNTLSFIDGRCECVLGLPRMQTPEEMNPQPR